MKVISYVHKGKVRHMTLDDLKMMKVAATREWEKLCKRCGKCCFEKVTNGKGVSYIHYGRPCPNLKFAGGESACKIYKDRLDFGKCNTIPNAMKKGLLPANCPYVKGVEGYKAPADDHSWYKKAKSKMMKSDSPIGGTPTGATRNAPAAPPPRMTALEAQSPNREDLKKPKDWKRRQFMNRKRKAGKAGMLDPREKTTYNIKPSGHAGGG